MFDLIIKKGMAVLPDAVEVVDIAVKNGVIAAIAPTIDERAVREINALGQYVMPGMVDVHMHLSEPGRTEWEGYRTGTQAMAAGGITSFAEMPLNQIPCTTDVPSLEIKLKAAEGQCWVDYAPMGGLVPWNLKDLAPLADAGVAAFKAFVATCGSGKPGDFKNVTDFELFRGAREIAKKDGLLIVHCENATITDGLGAEARAAGETSLSAYVASRPIFTEVEAVHRVLMIAAEFILHIAPARKPLKRSNRQRLAAWMRVLSLVRITFCWPLKTSMLSGRRQSALHPFGIVRISTVCGSCSAKDALRCSFPITHRVPLISRLRPTHSMPGAASADARIVWMRCLMRLCLSAASVLWCLPER